MIASRNRDAGSTHDEIRDELDKELRFLRSVVREVGEGFVIRKEGEIETLIGYLDLLPPRAVRQMSRSWLKEMRNLPVKPAKGRLKDLKRIDLLLEELLDTVIELQHGAKSKPAKADGGSARETDCALPKEKTE